MPATSAGMTRKLLLNHDHIECYNARAQLERLVEIIMPDLVLHDMDAELHERLTQWAHERGIPVSLLARKILAAAESINDNFDPTQSRSTRDIRRSRDGGCGFCDDLEMLFARRKAPAEKL
jgi:hypothetical protein